MVKNKYQKFVVLGAGGFIGSRMVAFLKSKGHWVRAVYRTYPKDKEQWLKKADESISADLFSLSDTMRAIAGTDCVFHFAADMGGVGYFSEAQYTPTINNVLMDVNVIKACEDLKISRLFYPSSACIFPIDRQSSTGLRENEVLPANADQMYGWEKLFMTLLLPYAPIDIRVGILHTIFGEGQPYDGKRAKFPDAAVYKAIMAKKNNSSIEIWGNGKQERTFLYIDDALEKIYEVMMKKKYWGPVNIASSETVTIQQCVEWCCEFAHTKKKFTYNLSKPSGVLQRGSDNTMFNKHYVYRSKVSTKDGFRRVYKFLSKKLQ
jgi:nucleoside-diphosphate-sugar epimerase